MMLVGTLPTNFSKSRAKLFFWKFLNKLLDFILKIDLKRIKIFNLIWIIVLILFLNF
jgi:hypothetical protein